MTYEQRVVEFLQRMLLAHQIGQGNRRINIDDIHLEEGGEYGDRIVILFREVRRPNCLFGFRTEGREPPSIDSLGRQWKESEDSEGESSQVSADIIFANFQERIEAADMGLPEDCNPDGITWITGLTP